MKEQIIEILTNLRPEFDFSQESINFINEGMLDSFDLVVLVSELEQNYNIAVDGVDVVPENFESIEAIENLINKSIKK